MKNTENKLLKGILIVLVIIIMLLAGIIIALLLLKKPDMRDDANNRDEYVDVSDEEDTDMDTDDADTDIKSGESTNKLALKLPKDDGLVLDAHSINILLGIAECCQWEYANQAYIDISELARKEGPTLLQCLDDKDAFGSDYHMSVISETSNEWDVVTTKLLIEGLYRDACKMYSELFNARLDLSDCPTAEEIESIDGPALFYSPVYNELVSIASDGVGDSDQVIHAGAYHDNVNDSYTVTLVSADDFCNGENYTCNIVIVPSDNEYGFAIKNISTSESEAYYRINKFRGYMESNPDVAYYSDGSTISYMELSNMLNEYDGSYLGWPVYRDFDNDGDLEMLVGSDNPMLYGGIIIDYRDNRLNVLDEGSGTAEWLSYVYFEDAYWLVKSDTSHAGRQIYNFIKYNGDGDVEDSFVLGAEFWDKGEYDATSDFTYRDEAITMAEYESLKKIIFRENALY